jgi:hypothetical protein
MRPLEYRSPRVASAFRIDFRAGTERFRGNCIDISQSGVRGRFLEELPLDLEGELTLLYPGYEATFPARVVYVLEGQVGFTFLERPGFDRSALTQFLAALHPRP